LYIGVQSVISLDLKIDEMYSMSYVDFRLFYTNRKKLRSNYSRRSAKRDDSWAIQWQVNNIVPTKITCARVLLVRRRRGL